MPKLHKYDLYERSVQSPDVHIPMFVAMYRETFGKYARHLREDFCGTFSDAVEWVNRNKKNTALCIDLDPAPLAYGKKHHLKRLTREQQSRIDVRRGNAVSVTSPKSDIVIACNFSFFIFKQRAQLIEYLTCVRRSLTKDGMLILETLGGPGAIETSRERRPIFEKGKRLFTYFWDQRSFNPITHEARYSIHFNLANGRELRHVFQYDWRLWSIPELRDCLLEAGFDDVGVWWETEHEGEGTGEYVRTENGDNAYSWIAYVCGIKKR
ncbi:MAG: class I SAM-dependent methyltransferase [Oligoflexia bacterium]|nr:class I SAM-dependent methyltransferase [Oligoflexia bacterium]